MCQQEVVVYEYFPIIQRGANGAKRDACSVRTQPHLGPVAQLQMSTRSEDAWCGFKGCFFLSFIIMSINNMLRSAIL